MTRKLNIGSLPPPDRYLSRRAFMLSGMASVAALSACQPKATEETGQLAAWPNVDVPEVNHPGYGWEPDYFALTEGGPWPRILSGLQKRQLEKISDGLLPATETAPPPSEVGVAEFWDEWVSAPYSWQTDTRDYVYNGLAWLDAQCQKMFGKDFIDIDEAELEQLYALWSSISKDEGEQTKIGWFFHHMRYLTIGAYYTTPEGMADIGHIKNVPIQGDYPGPSDEAMAHLTKTLADVGISL